LDPYS